MGEGTLKWKEVVDVESFERASVALPILPREKFGSERDHSAGNTGKAGKAGRPGGAPETRVT